MSTNFYQSHINTYGSNISKDEKGNMRVTIFIYKYTVYLYIHTCKHVWFCVCLCLCQQHNLLEVEGLYTILQCITIDFAHEYTFAGLEISYTIFSYQFNTKGQKPCYGHHLIKPVDFMDN